MKGWELELNPEETIVTKNEVSKVDEGVGWREGGRRRRLRLSDFSF